MVRRVVEFDREEAESLDLRFLGRNGSMKCHGLEIFVGPRDGRVVLMPITSKGVCGRCLIEVPVSALKRLHALLDPRKLAAREFADKAGYARG